MKIYYLYVLFLLSCLFLKANSTLYVSMYLLETNACLTRISNETNEYFKSDTNLEICTPNESNYPSLLLTHTPYEIGETINVEFYYKGEDIAYFRMTVLLSGYVIKTEDQKYWTCKDCGGENGNYLYNDNDKRFYFYNNTLVSEIKETGRNFQFLFEIPSSDKDEFIKSNIDDNYYILTAKTNFIISPRNLDEEIELINFKSLENLNVVNDEIKEIPDSFYKELGFRIYLDEYAPIEGEFVGLDTSNNDVTLKSNDIFMVSEEKGLRYKFSDSEKENNGIYLKFRLEGITSPFDLSLSKSITKKEEFNFYICLNEYVLCDIGPSMKCLKEGYYCDDPNESEPKKCYSCFETCGNCDSHKKPKNANYNRNYCDSCNDKNPYYLDIEDYDENGNIINYKNCFERCPGKKLDSYQDQESKDCSTECQNLKTNDNICVDYCDSKEYKYFYVDEKKCYNYIPKKYKIYVDNYDERYNDNVDYAIIKMSEECPDDSYDSSFNNICIKTSQDASYLINPLVLIKYSNPKILWLKEKTILLRAYTTEIQLKEIIANSGGQYTTIDISKCEQVLKDSYGISLDESLIKYDINDLTNGNYEYKVYSLEGNELDINICSSSGIILCEYGYYLPDDGNECLKCPDKCSQCSYNSVNQNLCLECNNDLGYYKLYLSSKNNLPFLECFNEENKREDLKLNKKLLRYEPCYETCKECFDYGNSERNNCSTCISGYIIREENPNNCVANCEFYYYYNDYGQYRCTETYICPGDMYLIKDKKKCIKDCNKNIPFLYQFKGECIEECPENTIIKDGHCVYNDNGECAIIRDNLDVDLNALIDENGQEADQIVLKYAKDHQNMNNEIYNYINKMYNFIIYKNEDCLNEYLTPEIINITKIDLKTCYDLLIDHYNFTERNIIILIIDIYRQNQSPYTYYNFYHPETGVKLEAYNVCYNSKVNKKFKVLSFDMDHKESITYFLSQGVDVLNISSRFFTDLCYPFEFPNGKDFPLKERVSFFYPNITICDGECINKGINFEKYEVECECNFINIINNKLINNELAGTILEIYDENEIIGEVMKCYKDIFKYKYFIKNYGSMIILILLIPQIILTFIYFYKNVSEIRKFTLGLINSYLSNLNKKNNKDNKENINIIITKNDDVHDDKHIISNLPIKKRRKKNSIKPKTNMRKSLSSNRKIIIDKMSSRNEMIQDNDNNKISASKSQSINKFNSNKPNKKEEIDKKYILPDGELEDFLKESLEDLDFDEALAEDKRKFCEIYKDMLLSKHMFLSIIFEEDKYKPRSLRFIIYLLSLNLYFFINALFFSESYISELCREEKEEKFLSFILRSINRIINCCLAASIINFLLDFIIIDGNKIKNILNKRKDLTPEAKKGEINKILFKIEKSMIFFFIINYLLMIISWYYISCFNNVYSYTKIEWIKSSVLIIIIMNLLPFFYSLFFSLLRFIALRCQVEKIYKIVIG